ncbi:MAG: hypothetical protein AcusKO_29530 [Acuticoccus sp.]
MRSIDNTGLSRPARIDAGAVPMLQWVPIELLVVDETYQRPLEPANLKAIQRIADAFSWSKFSTVHVARSRAASSRSLTDSIGCTPLSPAGSAKCPARWC